LRTSVDWYIVHQTLLVKVCQLIANFFISILASLFLQKISKFFHFLGNFLSDSPIEVYLVKMVHLDKYWLRRFCFELGSWYPNDPFCELLGNFLKT